MRRLVWLGIGVAIGVTASRKATQVARAATPAGVAGNIGAALSELAGAIGTFGADVRAGMNEREQELTETVARRSGIDPTPRQAWQAAAETMRASAPGPARPALSARARQADG